MKFLTLKFFITSCFLLVMSFSHSTEKPKIGNLIIHENPIKHYNVVFKSLDNQEIRLE